MHEKKYDSIPLPFLAATAVVCGALIMVVEVLGSRVLGPFYGVSLFVWTSLITVTLVALAAGYAAGGVLSDRKSSPDWLYGIILLAGFLVLLIPLMKGPVLKFCLPLGLRMGSLASALLLFGPSLFLLGCVSPYIVRIAARGMASIGRTVGVFYAVSTVGSFFGTILTGFVLIAYLGVNRIFIIVGALLLLLSGSYFVLLRRRGKMAAVLLAAVPLLLVSGGGPVSKVSENGTRVARIFEQDSFYGNIKVVDYSYGPVRTRELMIDGLIQGGIDLGDGMSVYEYAYLMQHLPRMLNPDGRECLVIGVGAGVVPLWYERQGVRVDVVDIDPAVPEIARRYFGFRVSGDVVIEDARYFLGRAGKQYDYIILDVFNGDTTPGHVLSIEAMRLLRSRLAPNGILAINLIGSLREDNFMTASVVRTVGQVFGDVRIYPSFDPGAGREWGNLAIIAADRLAANPPAAAFGALPVHRLPLRSLGPALGRTVSFPVDTPAIVLTDDYNPIDTYDLRLKERVRRDILDSTDWDILL